MEQIPLNRKEIGQKGEDYTASYFKSLGFRIIERNYWKPYGEIDLVAKLGDNLHFVEVKTLSEDVPRGTFRDFDPADHMNYQKKLRQKRIIEAYILDRKVGEDDDWQVDLASVVVDKIGNLINLEIIEDIIL